MFITGTYLASDKTDWKKTKQPLSVHHSSTNVHSFLKCLDLWCFHLPRKMDNSTRACATRILKHIAINYTQTEFFFLPASQAFL